MSPERSIFIVSEIFVIGFGVLFVLRSTRSILRIFRYTLPVSALGLLAFVIAMLIHSKTGLHANFDHYAKSFDSRWRSGLAP